MFTTMNCDSLETKYYYATQHRSQGESECLDTLNLLRYFACGDGRGHSTADESHLSTQPEDHVNVIQTAPNLIPEMLYMEEKVELAHKGRYQQMVGKLIYLSHTRPDIAYAEGVVSQFMHQPQKNHMKAVMRILRYLKGTTGHGVLFKPNGHLVTQLYTHVDWAGDKGNRRSTSGYFTVEVSQQRFFPKKVSRGSRYPMANIAKGNLSKDAKAFVASVYFDGIPANTEQALSLIKWKKAMEEEMEALTKNNTREKCVLKPRKKIVGCRWGGNLITCLIIYVDDMIVIGDDKEEITKLKNYLFTEFKKKDLGRLKYFLRIEVLRSKQGIFMCQKRKERVPETYDYRSQYDAYECDTYHANYNIEMSDDTMYRAHEASFVALETHVDWLLKQLNRDETYEPQGITKLDFDDEDKDEEDVDDHNDSFEDLISPIKEHDKESVPFKDGEEVMEANTTPSSQL
nr:putative reverse transcriptase, RNA-dependent DNA polymerase [Tanacetum cinerariifolium]